MGLCGAVFVLFLAWLLSLPVRWLLGTDLVVSMAFALGALGIMAIAFHAISTQRAMSIPWGLAEDDFDDGEDETDGENEANKDGEQANWFKPCLCGSGKAFARCCGKRSFKRK